MDVETFTLHERPDLAGRIDELSRQAWPEFLRHADALNWGALFDTFQAFQLLICDRSGELLAVGHTVPLVWDGTRAGLPGTIAAIIDHALDARDGGGRPNTLSALAAMVRVEHRGRGLSLEIIRQMKSLALRWGCHSLIAPVRPTLKDRYPLVPMERYARWTRPDGEAFDPWLRVHLRLGGEMMQVADCALAVTGSVLAWEGWTGMSFQDSGEYVVPGALQPVRIDRERDTGRYEDPNVWMRHAVSPQEEILA